MEISVAANHAVKPQVSFRRFPPTSDHHPETPRSMKPHRRENRRPGRLAAKCIGSHAAAPVSEMEKLEVDESVITEEEMSAIGRWSEKCQGAGGGTAEMLECLEKEAIMGDDEGKDPKDYNRRAMIFDKSSRVFQALKESHCTTSSM